LFKDFLFLSQSLNCFNFKHNFKVIFIIS
jgi:hypothetical protein